MRQRRKKCLRLGGRFRWNRRGLSTVPTANRSLRNGLAQRTLSLSQRTKERPRRFTVPVNLRSLPGHGSPFRGESRGLEHFRAKGGEAHGSDQGS